ncbi:MAG: proteasome lid subunit RPN8/RPN11 [Natronomonas sp.]|jgi:proteasome lid subunit RPN8/RPN11
MLRITRAVYDAAIDHAREDAPAEVCGVLGGDRGATGHARTLRRAENAADEPRTEYRIEPTAQLALIEEIEADGEEVVGFYHSHPGGPAAPSPTDRRCATWTDRSYVIVVLDGGWPYVGSWRWTGERFEQETVTLS